MAEFQAPAPVSEADFRLLADATSAMVWITGADGQLSFVNRAYAEFVGLSLDAALALDWRSRAHPDDSARIQAEAAAGEASLARFTVLGRYARADGAWRWIEAMSQPRRDADGRHTGFVGVAHDVTQAHEAAAERRRAETEQRDSEARFRALFEQANDYIIVTDLEHRITAINPATLTALGYALEEMIGRSIADFLTPDQFALARESVARKLAGTAATRLMLDVSARDGRTLTWEISSRLLRDGDGQPVALHAIARDMTEAKRVEARQRLLIDELNHRVKNTLAIVQGIAQQTFRGAGDPMALRRAFEGRLAALSEAHDLLTREHWGPVSMRRILHDVVAPYGLDGGRFELDGPDLMLPPQTAISLALAMHELTTNAVKHGALTRPEGRVDVRWTVCDTAAGARLRLSWREAGGPAVAAPSRRGFGTRMIERGLAAELGGTVHLDFAPTGVVCSLDAPLPVAAA